MYASKALKEPLGMAIEGKKRKISAGKGESGDYNFLRAAREFVPPKSRKGILSEPAIYPSICADTEYVDVPPYLKKAIGKSIEVEKEAIGNGIRGIFRGYHNYDPSAVSGKVKGLMGHHEFLNRVKVFIPPESRKGILSADGLFQLKKFLDFFKIPENKSSYGHQEQKEKANLFIGYLISPTVYETSGISSKFWFSREGIKNISLDENIEKLSEKYNASRIRLGQHTDMLLDHNEQEIIVSQFPDKKFGACMYYVCCGIITPQASQKDIKIIDYIARDFGIFEEKWISSVDGRLFNF